ncbi:MAG: DUF2608 domain-containing protein [Holosporaceae bacterium]|nr:DUF2608 domain-containing protein [Holosporaceae bacterium]
MGTIRVFKKSFAVLGTVLCLQAAQSMTSDRVSEIHYCEDWRDMYEKMNTALSISENSLVIFDCDGVICNRVSGGCEITDPVLLRILEELKLCGISFFCMTAVPSIECAGRRKDFELAGVAPYFCDGSTVFDRDWVWLVGNDGKKYFVDIWWNTVYTIRPTGYEYTESKPLNFHDLDTENEGVMVAYRDYRARISRDRKDLKQPKGSVFLKLIEDGFLSKPDVVVFIDDQLVNLESMQSHCYSVGISYAGLFCQAYGPF